MQKEIVDLLEQFRQKAGAWQSQVKAENTLREIKKVVLNAEWMELSIAFHHFQLGQGGAELYTVCGKLISKYRQDSPPLNFKKTLL